MQGSKLEDYASYADFSQTPAHWQPRKYVPKWLWNLVAEKHFAIESKAVPGVIRSLRLRKYRPPVPTAKSTPPLRSCGCCECSPSWKE